MNYSFNLYFPEILPDTTLLGVKIFEFDQDYHLKAVSYAERGHHEEAGRWPLEDVSQTRFEGEKTMVVKLRDSTGPRY